MPVFGRQLQQRHRRYRRLIQGIAVFGGVVLALNLPWIIINADGFWQFLSYHMERGLHSESSYASVLLVGQMLGLTQVDAALTYGSWNISSTMADALYQASFYVTAGFLLLAYALYARRLWKKLATTAETEIFSRELIELILRYSLLAVFVMLLTSKVLSPQFLIWLCPLIPLVKGRWRYVPLVLFMVAGGITQYIYPHNYIDFELSTIGFELGKPYLIVLLFIRNLLILAMAIVYILPLSASSLDRE